MWLYWYRTNDDISFDTIHFFLVHFYFVSVLYYRSDAVKSVLKLGQKTSNDINTTVCPYFYCLMTWVVTATFEVQTSLVWVPWVHCALLTAVRITQADLEIKKAQHFTHLNSIDYIYIYNVETELEIGSSSDITWKQETKIPSFCFKIRLDKQTFWRHETTSADMQKHFSWFDTIIEIHKVWPHTKALLIIWHKPRNTYITTTHNFYTGLDIRTAWRPTITLLLIWYKPRYTNYMTWARFFKGWLNLTHWLG